MPSPVPTSPIKLSCVLVVDDVPVMRTLTTSLLQQVGIKRVLEAGDGVEALQVLAREPVDAVISDWRMPGMDGLALLARLRDEPRTAMLPFVLVSAEQDPKLRDEALKAGAQAVLVKPYSPLMLADTLRKAIAAGSSVEPPNIVIADAQPTRLKALTAVLKPEGRLRVAVDAERLLELCDAEPHPDLLLIDAALTGSDDLPQLARRLNLNNPLGAQLVLLTEDAPSIEATREALSAERLLVLQRPPNHEALQMLVRPLAQGAAQRRLLHTQQQQHKQEQQRRTSLQQQLDSLQRLAQADLRAPLASALGLLEPLLDGSEAAEQLELALLEALDGLHLVSTLTQIEQQCFELRTRGVPLRRLLERLQRLTEAAYAHKALKLHIDLPGPARGPSALFASGDPLLCHTLLQLLLRLAGDLAPPNSTLSLHAELVRDAGHDNVLLQLRHAGTLSGPERLRAFNPPDAGKALDGPSRAYAARRFAQAQRGDLSLEIDSQGQSLWTLRLLKSQLTMAAG